MTDNKPTLQECAMRYGTGMGILWAFKFMLIPLGLRIPLLQLLFIILTLGVPILGYMFVKKYREQYCEGSIGFPRAFAFTLYMYMYATLFVAVAHYIYFRFVDNGFLISTYQEAFNQAKATAGAELMASFQQFDEVLNILSGFTPLEMTFYFISQNILYSILMAIPIALLAMRKKKNL